MAVFMGVRADGHFDNIETDYDTLVELKDALAASGLVLCAVLVTRRGEHARERVVTRRRGAIITAHADHTIREPDPDLSFVEIED